MWNDNRVRTLLEEEDLDYERMTHRDAFTARDVAAATHVPEREVAKDCERGAIPPLGNLYDIPTFVDSCLCDVPEVFFPAGSRREVVGMRFADYQRAARPMVGQFCFHAGMAREGAGAP